MSKATKYSSVVDELNSLEHFKIFVYGGSGSGKTTFIKHALANLLYEDLYILCATYWDDYVDLANLFRVTSDYNYAEIQAWMQNNNGKKKLIVLDDILTMGLNRGGTKRGQMEGIFADMRHYNCSAIISTQKVKGVPDTIRMLYTHVIATRVDPHIIDMIDGDLPEEFCTMKKMDKVRALYVRDYEYLYFSNKGGRYYVFRLDI